MRGVGAEPQLLSDLFAAQPLADAVEGLAESLGQEIDTQGVRLARQVGQLLVEEAHDGHFARTEGRSAWGAAKIQSIDHARGIDADVGVERLVKIAGQADASIEITGVPSRIVDQFLPRR